MSGGLLQKSAIGIDLGGTNIKAGIVNNEGTVVYQSIIPTHASSGGEALLERIIAIVKELSEHAEKVGCEVVGIGIGSAGQVNGKDGIIAGATSNLPGWAGMEVASLLEQAVHLPVKLENDANALAYGEAWLGAGQAWQDFVCVTLGTGVGGCVIQGRRPYHGMEGFAGEFGHHVIAYDGYPCNCGRKGCWEQYASVTALMRYVHEYTGNAAHVYPSAEILFAKAVEGDALALQFVDRYAELIAAGVLNLIHMFNPEGVVIGGAVTAQGDFLFNRIRRSVDEGIMPVFRGTAASLRVVPALLGENAGIVGAAAPFLMK